MAADAPRDPDPVKRRIAVVAAAATLLSGVSGLAGWALHIPLLTTGGSSYYTPLAPSTSIALLLFGGALVLRTFSGRACVALAALVVPIAVRPIALLAGIPLPDIERNIMSVLGVEGTALTMSPLAAACFLLLSSAIFAIRVAARRPQAFAGLAGTVVTAAAFTILLGYLYNAPLLYASALTPVSLPGALGLFAAGIGVVALTSSAHLPLRPFAGTSTRARLLRALVPTTMCAFLVNAVAGTLLMNFGLNPAVVSTLLVFGFGALVMLIVTSVAEVVGAAVDEASAVRERSREELELMVQDRTSQLAGLTEAFRRAKLEAERSNRAKSVFLSRMSHDLRTPLNSILGFAQLLGSDGLSSDQQRNARHIIDAGEHLLDLINEVLDIARIESGRLAISAEPVAAADVIRRANELIAPLAQRRHITIEAVPPEAGCYVRADHQRLMQVLVNLLSNAVKYNRHGGHIEVGCEGIGRETVRISVRDTGIGLRADQLELVFMPFERLDAAQSSIEGTGLGLALAKGLTEAMGGQIGVESRPQEGSTFWIELPSAPPPPAVGAEPPLVEPAPLPSARGGTVLYVEDNPANVRLMERVLARRPGVRLLVADDGATGVAEARAKQPDLVLLDLHLPRVSGEDALRQLRAHRQTRHIPVVVLSADAAEESIERLLAAGATDYLTKPLDIARVLRLVDRHCAGRGGLHRHGGRQAG